MNCCGGCADKVPRVLSNINGVKGVQVQDIERGGARD